MIAIVAYGSLIHRAERERVLGRAVDCAPVTVHGYRRAFNQEPSWRTGRRRRRAVLAVVPAAADSLNAVLIVVPDDAALGALDDRERGYRRTRMPHRSFEGFAGHALPPRIGRAFIYVGRRELRNDDLLPNARYLARCREGARQWGAAFLERFLQTTYVGAEALARAPDAWRD